MKCEYCGADNAQDPGNLTFQCVGQCKNTTKVPLTAKNLERFNIIEECLTELVKYAFTSHSCSVLRKLQRNL